ncbi:MAG: putative acid sphingomyelinase-like protein phosphodiesterase transmembrane protein [uncultured bacterium]|nr:MAG: putative acid sphingomyelinase-like protein phosphodiesterase transmembrane protein [uncultured bacterium]
MKSTYRRIIILLLIAFVGSGQVFAISSVSKFVSIADIHFNPLADCKPSFKSCPIAKKLRIANYEDWDKIFNEYSDKQLARAGQDTNYALFQSAFNEWQKVNQQEHPKFGLVLGDFLVHAFRTKYIAYSHDTSRSGYEAFVKKTLQFMTSKINQAFPETDIYAAVGNNDSYTGDYSSVPDGSFFQDTARTWSILIHNTDNRENFIHDFPEGGYYAVSLPHHKNQRILVLNTVLFSAKARGVHVDQAAKKELAWLHQQLMLAAKEKQKVILAFHIPVGIDVYATLQTKLTSVVVYWKPKYSQAFEAELKNFASSIKEILPAHIHIDAFQVVMINQLGEVPVSFTPSISPIFGNNPAFKVFSYHPDTLNLTRFDTYFYPLKKGEYAGWRKESQESTTLSSARLR